VEERSKEKEALSPQGKKKKKKGKKTPENLRGVTKVGKKPLFSKKRKTKKKVSKEGQSPQRNLERRRGFRKQPPIYDVTAP